MEDLNKPRRNIPSLSEPGFGLWEFFSQKSSSTFEKVRELKESRWRLKERDFKWSRRRRRCPNDEVLGGASKFWVCGRNPLVLPFFSAVLSPGAICFYSVSEHEICQFFRILFLATSGSERLNILNYFTIRDHKVLLIFASW